MKSGAVSIRLATSVGCAMNGSLADKLKGKRRVHVDSNVLIYFLQRNPIYTSLVRPLFELIADGKVVGVSSYITLLEIMIRPLQEGNTALAMEYRDYLVSSRNFELFPVDREIAEEGANIRATFKTKTPDSIQLATALRQRADIFLTNDEDLRRFNRMEVLVINDLIDKRS